MNFTPSPSVKLELSPTDSFLDEPAGGDFPLFGSLSSGQDTMTPQDLSALASPAATTPSTPTTEKKPTKKRKSWGQVLPEPKTSLPPR
jgi:transcriptional activator HAC1